jgi:hypothetical protein
VAAPAPSAAIGETPDSGDPLDVASASSALDPDAMEQARALLARPERPERMWPVLAAAGLLAVSALAFATAMIMAPPLVSEHAVLQHAPT